MDNLLKEYQQSLKSLRKEKEKAVDYEQKIYAGMITDLEIAVAWMKTGRPPGDIKGVYGHYISNAIQLDPETFDYVNCRPVDGVIPLDPFTEIENRIDKERQARKRA